MSHFDTFREQLAIAHPAFGHALWEPGPGEYPPVEVGDVGFVRDGKFHRLFNALLPANDPTHENVPAHHEPLEPRMRNHIDRGILTPNNFYSYGVSEASGGFQASTPGSIGTAEFSFKCIKKHGAVLCLPVTARRTDTLTRDHFRKWIIEHIDSWFAFTQHLGLGIDMEEIILVTGYHRTRSWSNIAFNEVQADARLALGVNVGGSSASVHWRVSNLRIQGAVLSHRPNGEDLPEDQCIFIRGYRVKRVLFGTIRWIKAAAEPNPDTRGEDCEPEKEAVSIPGVTEYRDPLHVLLEYIAKREPHCDMALVHDDDLEGILGVGDRTALENLQPGAMMDHLQRLQLEISVMSDSLPANVQSPRTDRGQMKVAMLSEKLKKLGPSASVPLLSQITSPSDPSSRNFSSSGSGTTEYGTSIGDIIKTVERFRILVVGRSGVGKSSLINCVFGINNASVAHYKPGESDIQQEFESPENQYFVLHDSKGFEPGDLSNFDTVRAFIQQRSKPDLPPRDRIHGLWLCVETPPAGGRVFEKGDELLLQFAHEIQIPVVLVFTQYDRLVRSKILELQEDYENMDENSLRIQSVKDASEAFNKCLRSVQGIMNRLRIPMPHCAKVSVRSGYQDSVSALVEGTRDVVRERPKGDDAWIMWAIAQRASPSVKLDACVSKGMSYHNYFLPGSMPGSGKLLLRDCLEKAHRDIITCWNFKGKVLDSKEFELLMLRLIQDVQTEPGAYRSNIDVISQFVALVAPSHHPIEPLASILGLTPNFMQWFSTAFMENTSWLQRFLVTYTVDLISVLRGLFDPGLTANSATWGGLQGAYEVYERSGSRQNLHSRILLNMAPGGHVLNEGDVHGMVRELLAM